MDALSGSALARRAVRAMPHLEISWVLLFWLGVLGTCVAVLKALLEDEE